MYSSAILCPFWWNNTFDCKPFSLEKLSNNLSPWTNYGISSEQHEKPKWPGAIIDWTALMLVKSTELRVTLGILVIPQPVALLSDNIFLLFWIHSLLYILHSVVLFLKVPATRRQWAGINGMEAGGLYEEKICILGEETWNARAACVQFSSLLAPAATDL